MKFPPCEGNVIELSNMCRPFRAENGIKLYTQGCPPWAIPCQPFGLYLKGKIQPPNSMTLPCEGGERVGALVAAMLRYASCIISEGIYDCCYSCTILFI